MTLAIALMVGLAGVALWLDARGVQVSLYNTIFGFNPACVLLLPMIGKARGDFPRFRDCFAQNPFLRTIVVFTRTGGGNREAYEKENDEITKIDGFVKDWDDDSDSTFAYWEFAVPEKWHADYDRIMAGEFSELSEDYVSVMKSAYPKLVESIDKLTETESKGGDQ